MALNIPIDLTTEQAITNRTLDERYYRLSIDVENNGSYVDFTDYIQSNSLSGSGKKQGANGESVGNLWTVRINNVLLGLEAGDLAECPVRIDFQVGSGNGYYRLFTGWIDDRGITRKRSSLTKDIVFLSIVDIASRPEARRTITPQYWINYKIADPTDKAHSIYHQLAYALGLDDTQIEDVTIDHSKSVLIFNGNTTAWEELQNLASQFLGFITWTNEGILRFVSMYQAGYDDSSELTIIPQKTTKEEKNKLRCNRVKTAWESYRALDSDSIAGRVIYKNLESFSQSNGKIEISIPPGGYWPGGDDEYYVAKLEYSEPTTGDEFPLATDIKTPTIGAWNSGSDIEYEGTAGILTIDSFNGTGVNPDKTIQRPAASEIILHNTSETETVVIRKFELRGDPWIIDSNTVEAYDTGLDYYTEKRIPGKYACSTDQAAITCNWWKEFGDEYEARRRWDCICDWIPQLQEGAFITLQLPEESIICQVLSYKHSTTGKTLAQHFTQLILEEKSDHGATSGGSAVVTTVTSDDPDDTIEQTSFILHEELVTGWEDESVTNQPVIPVNLTVKSSGRSLIASWEDPQFISGFGKKYDVQVSSPGTDLWSSINTDGMGTLGEYSTILVQSVEIPRAVLAGTDEDPESTTYHFRVRMRIGDEVSDWSDPASGIAFPWSQVDIAKHAISIGKLETNWIQTRQILDALEEDVDKIITISDRTDQHFRSVAAKQTSENALIHSEINQNAESISQKVTAQFYYPNHPDADDDGWVIIQEAYTRLSILIPTSLEKTVLESDYLAYLPEDDRDFVRGLYTPYDSQWSVVAYSSSTYLLLRSDIDPDDMDDAVDLFLSAGILVSQYAVQADEIILDGTVNADKLVAGEIDAVIAQLGQITTSHLSFTPLQNTDTEADDIITIINNGGALIIDADRLDVDGVITAGGLALSSEIPTWATLDSPLELGDDLTGFTGLVANSNYIGFANNGVMENYFAANGDALFTGEIKIDNPSNPYYYLYISQYGIQYRSDPSVVWEIGMNSSNAFKFNSPMFSGSLSSGFRIIDSDLGSIPILTLKPISSGVYYLGRDTPFGSIDLGRSDYRFRNGYFSGTVYADYFHGSYGGYFDGTVRGQLDVQQYASDPGGYEGRTVINTDTGVYDKMSWFSGGRWEKADTSHDW